MWTCRREAAAQLPTHLALSEGLQDEIPLTDAQRRLPGPVHGCEPCKTMSNNSNKHAPSIHEADHVENGVSVPDKK